MVIVENVDVFFDRRSNHEIIDIFWENEKGEHQELILQKKFDTRGPWKTDRPCTSELLKDLLASFADLVQLD